MADRKVVTRSSIKLRGVFREEHHYTNDFDKDNVFEGWASLPPHASFYDSLETAKREAIFGVSWQADHK